MVIILEFSFKIILFFSKLGTTPYCVGELSLFQRDAVIAINSTESLQIIAADKQKMNFLIRRKWDDVGHENVEKIELHKILSSLNTNFDLNFEL